MRVTTDIFKAGTLTETADSFAAHMPDGLAWQRKQDEGSNIRGLVVAMSVPANAVEQKIEELATEMDINQTVALINEWEKSVGLPDACLDRALTIEQRRDAVVSRIRKRPIVTLAEMQQEVDMMFPDSNIILVTGREFYTFEYEFETGFLGDVSERFIIVGLVPSQSPFFEFDFEVDFTGGVNATEFECLMRRIIPANVIFLVEEVPSNA